VTGHRLIPAGDAALVVEFDERIDPATSARSAALAEAVLAENIGGVRDVVPTYRSVAVYFDPLQTDQTALSRTLGRLAARPRGAVRARRDAVRIPVCYGGVHGPDLAEVAALAHLSEPEVVTIHSSAVYRVLMLGFTPGFAYMGMVDARIAAPRLASPRRRVPWGSVGIAQRQTGVYPSETPGGWRIVGRTPLRTFDLSRPEPCVFRAGDDVQFVPITPEEFDERDRTG
jgi:inhibitor of KinA